LDAKVKKNSIKVTAIIKNLIITLRISFRFARQGQPEKESYSREGYQYKDYISQSIAPNSYFIDCFGGGSSPLRSRPVTVSVPHHREAALNKVYR
jgi:hypothetical protein